MPKEKVTDLLDEILLFLVGPPPGAQCGNCRWFETREEVSIDGKCGAEPPRFAGHDLSGYPFYSRPTVWHDELCRHWRAYADRV